MEAVLIIAGAGLVLWGWLWLLRKTLRLGLAKLLFALFLAPLTILARGMGYPLLPRLLLLLGLSSLLVGTGLLYQHEPERLNQLLTGRWVEPASPDGALHGLVTGQAFVPERTYWAGNDLIFEEGPAERVRRSLVIRFSNTPELFLSGALERLPGDGGAWPELILQWHAGALASPGLRRLGNGYSLSVKFSEPAEEQVEGYIYLQLPATYGTWLTGDFTLSPAPVWMQKMSELQVEPVVSSPAQAVATIPSNEKPVAGWQVINPQALLSDPDSFHGSELKLTTSTGRQHQGVFRELSPNKSLILAQPRGPHQVELHFQPSDIGLLEFRTRL